MTQNHLKMQRQQRFCLLAGLLLLGRLADARWDQNRGRLHALGPAWPFLCAWLTIGTGAYMKLLARVQLLAAANRAIMMFRLLRLRHVDMIIA